MEINQYDNVLTDNEIRTLFLECETLFDELDNLCDYSTIKNDLIKESTSDEGVIKEYNNRVIRALSVLIRKIAEYINSASVYLLTELFTKEVKPLLRAYQILSKENESIKLQNIYYVNRMAIAKQKDLLAEKMLIYKYDQESYEYKNSKKRIDMMASNVITITLTDASRELISLLRDIKSTSQYRMNKIKKLESMITLSPDIDSRTAQRIKAILFLLRSATYDDFSTYKSLLIAFKNKINNTKNKTNRSVH